MDAQTFQRRRGGAMQLMGEGVAVLPTAPAARRNGDVEYAFRPDSDFYYLTHFPEPEAVAVLIPGRADGEFVLFCREREPDKEIWNGRRAGLEGAQRDYHADQAFPIDRLDEMLPGLLAGQPRVFHPIGRDPRFDARVVGWINAAKAAARTGVEAPGELVDLTSIMHEQRLVKRTDELRVMRRAAKISAAAHVRAMQATRPAMQEYEVQAELEYVFRKHAGAGPAYPSIVAGGANACILHYTENRATLADGDLLLIDAACELDCYAADISRTFPVNGRFSDTQRAVYDIVLAAQHAAIDAVRAAGGWDDPHQAALGVLVDGLKTIGLLSGDRDGLIEQGAYRRFYMHRTGHWLGMDVHDVGDYRIDGEWRVLEPGMVLTVEPGLYIAAADDINPRWHHIGIRIEDDVLVTRDGNEVLSHGVPTAPDDIEALMAADTISQ